MIILDASVIIKWFQHEKDSDQALAFEDRHRRGEEIVGAPDLLCYEVANVLCHAKTITKKDTEQIFDLLVRTQIQLFTFSFLDMQEVLNFARERGLTVYDGAYVVLAKRLGCNFITADKMLCQKLKDVSFVRLLSE